MAKLVRFNEINLRKKIYKSLEGEKYSKFAFSLAKRRFDFAKNDLLAAFDEHLVTQELQQNPSEEGSEIVGHGNLVSFIGFDSNENPADELRRYLDNEIYMKKEPTIQSNSKKFKYLFPVYIPKKREVYDAFPTPDRWSTKSWIDMIENGVENVIYYIFTKSNAFKGFSRSGHGRQDENPVSKKDNSFRPKAYVTELLKIFKNKF